MTPATYRDRSAGLIFFGVIEILIGALSAMMIPLMLLALLASRSIEGAEGSLGLTVVLPNIVIYGLVAALFIAIGIGSIRARRWARALTLSLSWLGLITGIVAVFALCLFVLQYFGTAIFTGLPEAALVLVVVIIIGFFYVVLPLAFVLFYRSEDVVSTCRERDPNPSWFDETPPQIVSLVLVYALGLVSVLVMPAYNFLFPLFGTILGGWMGGMAWLVVAALLLYLLVATIRSYDWAWGVAMAASAVAALSSIVTAAVVPYVQWIDHMGLPLAQQEMMAELGSLSITTMVLLTVIMWASWIGYLMYIRRFFGDRHR